MNNLRLESSHVLFQVKKLNTTSYRTMKKLNSFITLFQNLILNAISFSESHAWMRNIFRVLTSMMERFFWQTSMMKCFLRKYFMAKQLTFFGRELINDVWQNLRYPSLNEIFFLKKLLINFHFHILFLGNGLHKIMVSWTLIVLSLYYYYYYYYCKLISKFQMPYR